MGFLEGGVGGVGVKISRTPQQRERERERRTNVGQVRTPLTAEIAVILPSALLRFPSLALKKIPRRKPAGNHKG